MDLDMLSVISPTANYITDIQPFVQTNMSTEYSGTRGGNTFTRALETRDIPIDGDDPYEQEITSNGGTLSMTLMDITQKVLRTTAPMERDLATGALIPSTTMKDEHYHSLTLIAGRVGERGWQVIHIPRTTGAESVAQEFAERGESSLPATFVAMRIRSATGVSMPPYYIWTFDADGNMELDEAEAGGITGAAAFSAELEIAAGNLAAAQRTMDAVKAKVAAADAQARADALAVGVMPTTTDAQNRSSGGRYNKKDDPDYKN